jgi:hypothetical protein
MGKVPSHKKVRVIVPAWGKEQDQFRKKKNS